ncbi:MAG: hypothetical protein K2X01_07305 [Cyanobacteria bacterium]|nr:hypothetical protein [Cyanobacteriota bacterium]
MHRYPFTQRLLVTGLTGVTLISLFSLSLPGFAKQTNTASKPATVTTPKASQSSQALPPLTQTEGYNPAPAFNPQVAPALAQNLPPLQGRVVTAPAGSFITASLQTPLSSQNAYPGQQITATLGSDLAAGGAVILSAGSQLEGQVVSSQSAGRTGKPGELVIRFTGATTPNGQRVPLSARIQTEDGSGIIRGGTTKGRLGKAALNTGVGAGLGAALGTALGPLSGGRVGRGAVFGTAVGAGSGALYAAFKKGEEAVLPAGQPVNIVLDQPLTTAPSAGGYGNQGYAPNYQPNNYAPGYGYPAQQGGYNQQQPGSYQQYGQPDPNQQQPYNYNYGG